MPDQATVPAGVPDNGTPATKGPSGDCRVSRPVARVTAPSNARSDLLPPALFTLGAGLALSSLVGPLGFDLVRYPLSETLLNQTIGLDAVTLFVVSPAAVMAGLLVRRSHRMGALLAVVVGAYTSYMYLQFVVGPDYSRYPGTLALHLGLFTLGWMIAMRAWRAAMATDLPATTRRGRARHASVLFGLAGFVVLRYLPAVAASLANDPIPEESQADPAMYWSIVLMDLGIFVPGVVATAIALRRGARWAERGYYVAVGWFVVVTLAVLAMAVVMVVNDDPYGAGAQIALFAVTATAVVAYAARLWGRLVDRRA